MLGSPIQTNLFPVAQQQAIRVLFIGNSYTYFNDLPWLTQQLAASAKEPKTLETEMVVVGGATLKSHWKRGKAIKRLKAKRWDYVVLQEQSNLPITNPKEMYNYATLFDAEIKRVNSQTVFYLTWAKQNQPETQQILTNSYMSIAKELKAKVAPVGIAWQKIQEANLKLNLYSSDQSHPSPIGSYVAACVFYTTFYENSPVGLSRRLYSSNSNTPQESNRIELESLSKTDAQMIQNLVEYIVIKR
ncbi:MULTISPECIES: SGNH/GDSL hydrolase family protein [unclassified Nostoc]|uniref:SGNH/GDSL hydrolase family protein n=1 Tax=unclassified Nostoc TaxID=2593658 RepID=UPI002AD3B7F1|nr:SGNH/GDSL hydrolase family protein [Nostoc sp. DedQUE03]MDZ7971659.1 SGNH/GDSL hydrolase family protein [Nostoc sp. DedQUE03]MDZ8045200.1 SGNH/GDSL hydrolase family protein [Nostoc sp. DedQUE02]